MLLRAGLLAYYSLNPQSQTLGIQQVLNKHLLISRNSNSLLKSRNSNLSSKALNKNGSTDSSTESHGGRKGHSQSHKTLHKLQHPPNCWKSHRFNKFTSVLINICTEQKYYLLTHFRKERRTADFMGNSKARLHKSVFR